MYSILHVETSNFYRTLIEKICSDIGAEYSFAKNLDDSLNVLQNRKIDLIITAIELEDSTGEELIIKINDSPYKNIPVVVITGTDSDEYRTRMFSLGIVDYISKKSGNEEIRSAILAYMREDNVFQKMAELKIAVCDDSKMDRYIMERIFTMAGISNVEYYESGDLLLASDKEYDIYLIDMVLKDMIGNYVIMKLRERGSEAVIIAISGVAHYKTISNTLNIGANDYIAKPFNNELLLSRIKTNAKNYILLNEVKQLAITDVLTSLYNRRHTMERLEDEIEKSKRYENPLSVMMIDVDHFKRINDEFGHLSGDVVLKKIAESIIKTLRDFDIVGRFGGEEFLVILPNTVIEDAFLVAERIRKNIESLKFSKKDIAVSVSIGVCQWSGDELKNLLSEADRLLYSAKANGRNRTER
ncbi:MAG TPA: diguanylate cyclase [Spirochaetota bacterium]|nr:diguanylate cyclase [Spirochaetota bacterium]HQE57768.1 diguanylate cyclase [Spirochaetota bacterium]